MRAGHHDILETVERIYDAAADPECWQAALEGLCSKYGGGRGTLLWHDVANGSGIFAQTAAWDPVWVEAYNTHYNTRNPWLANLKRRPVGKAVPAEFMCDRTSLVKTEFFSDFLEPQGIVSGVGVTIAQDSEQFIAVSVLFPEITALQERDNVSLLQRLTPHFMRAMQLNRRLEMTAIRGSAAEAALDALRIGVVLATASGRVTFSNRSAERILTCADGLAIDRNGQILASSPALTARIRSAVGAASRAMLDEYDTNGGTLAIGRPSGKQAYSVLVSPLGPSVVRLGPPQAVVAILISDPAVANRTSSDALARAFGITKAEGRLLKHLVDGLSILDASRATGISPHTARTHLKHIFQKLGCSRQTDLIKAVTDHPVWIVERE